MLGGIDHVLAGGAPVHIARRIDVGLGDIGGERLDEGDREIAGARRGLGQGGKVNGWPCRTSRLYRQHLRDDAGCRLGARKCGFKIKHVLEIAQVVADRAHGGARQHGGEQGRQGSAHDARDLTIPPACANPKAFAQVCCAANMHRSSSHDPLPFGADVLYLGGQTASNPGGTTMP